MTIVHVTSQDHLDELLAGDLPVLVDYTAQWCAPCKQVEPDLHAFADDHEGRMVVAAVDIDELPDVYNAWGHAGVPTYRLIHRNKTVLVTGGMYREQLDEFYGSYLDAGLTQPTQGLIESSADSVDVRLPEQSGELASITAPVERLFAVPEQGVTADDLAAAATQLKPRQIVLFARGEDPLPFVEAVREASPFTLIGSYWATPELDAARVAAGLGPVPVKLAMEPARNLSVATKFLKREGKQRAIVQVTVPADWHAFAPGSTDGLPIEVAVTTPGLTVTEARFPETENGSLAGTFVIDLDITGEAERLDLELKVQLCRGDVCQPPTTVETWTHFQDVDAMMAKHA